MRRSGENMANVLLSCSTRSAILLFIVIRAYSIRRRLSRLMLWAAGCSTLLWVSERRVEILLCVVGDKGGNCEIYSRAQKTRSWVGISTYIYAISKYPTSPPHSRFGENSRVRRRRKHEAGMFENK